MFVIEFMDDVVESVEEVCGMIYSGLVKPLAVVIIQMLIILSCPAWIVPYKIFRKNGKNQKSAESYASEGEERC